MGEKEEELSFFCMINVSDKNRILHNCYEH